MRWTFVLVCVASLAAAAAAHGEPRVQPPPSATEFARVFIGLTTAYAVNFDQPERITRAHCVQAAPGRYMCSYALLRPGRLPECHLMQASWTPEAASTVTVTLAGRTSRCETLRAAIASLR